MKTYTDKTDRVDDRKCMFAQINGGDKARKKAVRRTAKKEIAKDLNEPKDESNH